ncbi:uncharacterized protein LOC119361045 [Triticum dicoccoides]|uniref:uncharacterized protein LOC119361045 n=1 Tax=Triticum dicoccoides TaxID=85692 RepID=UPI001890397B|nr:uncharacterized protein LOC119361045 [Triticum dicoccoides]XP_037482335.1 uncharacterized protein LOC119361045 [Triticum dicoccoides]
MGNRESSTCKDSYTKGSLYAKTSRMIRAEDLDLIVRLDGSKYDKESTERGTCMNRTEELLYAIKLFRRCEGLVFNDLPVRSRAPPLRSWVSTNDISSSPIHLLCFGRCADETC